MGTVGIDRAESIVQIRADLNISYIKLAAIGRLWDANLDKAAVYPRLRFLYTKRAACDNTLGDLWERVDFDQAGVKENSSDQFEHVKAIRDDVHAEILRLEKQANASAPPSIGLIAAHTPGVAPGQIGECFLNQRRDPRLPWNRTGR